MNRACAALNNAATKLCRFQIENVTNNPQQGHVARHIYSCRFAIYDELVGHVIPPEVGSPLCRLSQHRDAADKRICCPIRLSNVERRMSNVSVEPSDHLTR